MLPVVRTNLLADDDAPTLTTDDNGIWRDDPNGKRFRHRMGRNPRDL